MKTVRTVLLVVVACGLFAGCVENDRSLVVVGAGLWTEDCKGQVDPDLWLLGSTLDLHHTIFGIGTDCGAPVETDCDYWPSLFLFPQVENYMPNTRDLVNEQLDSMSVQLSRAAISYQWLQGRQEIAQTNPDLITLENVEQNVYMSGLVPASGGDEPGKLAIAGLRIITPETGNLLAALQNPAGKVLGVNVKFIGTTLGGTEVESNDLLFPVYLCRNCLDVVCCEGTVDEYYPGCFPGQRLDAACECQ